VPDTVAVAPVQLAVKLNVASSAGNTVTLSVLLAGHTPEVV